jgi:hypothetical protein
MHLKVCLSLIWILLIYSNEHITESNSRTILFVTIYHIPSVLFNMMTTMKNSLTRKFGEFLFRERL